MTSPVNIMQLQAEHRAQWVAALRSGKYKQDPDPKDSHLKTVDPDTGVTYHNLYGVAYEVSGLGAWEETPDRTEGLIPGRVIYRHRLDGYTHEYTFSDPLQAHLGIPTQTAFFVNRERRRYESLGNYHGEGALPSFAEIADKIEQVDRESCWSS